MDRRTFLATVGTVALAGCGSDGDDGTTGTKTQTEAPTATQSPTTTATETATETGTETPSPGPPEILAVNPVYRWEEFQDATENAIESVGAGTYLPVAARYRVWVHDGTLDITKQIRVEDAEGARVAMDSTSDEQLTEGSGFQYWEGVIPLDTSGWGRGYYEGEFLVRDDILSATSTAADWSVEIVAPLREDEVSVAYEGPDTVAVDEQFDYTLAISNQTARDSSLVSSWSWRVDGGPWYEYATRMSDNVPAGETVRHEESDHSFEESGLYEYRIDEIGFTWSIDVGEN